VHPVDRVGRLAERRDFGSALADAQAAQGGAGQALAGGGQRVASVSSQAMMSSPIWLAGEAIAAGSSSLGTTRNGGRSAGTARQVSRSS